MNIVGTKQLAVSHWVKLLVYARSGMGKTMLCATAPAPIIISAEAGLLSLAPGNVKKVYGQERNLPVIEVNSMRKLIDVHKWAQSSKEAQQFETICLDSISEMGELVLSAAKMHFKDPRQAYGEMIEQVLRVIRDFRALPKHIYFAAKEERIKDEASGITLYGPGMPGNKLAPAIPFLFDEMFNINIGKTKEGLQYRYLRTQPDLQYDAKDRSGALEVIEKPDLTYIINKIKTHG